MYTFKWEHFTFAWHNKNCGWDGWKSETSKCNNLTDKSVKPVNATKQNLCCSMKEIRAGEGGNVHMHLKWSTKVLCNVFCAHLIRQETGIGDDAVGREKGITYFRHGS